MPTSRHRRAYGVHSTERAEAKELTRRRLMTSAVKLLDESGGSKLTVSATCRRAGVAQSTFYVHFADLSDLLRTLGYEFAVQRGVAFRAARRKVREHPGDLELLRESFRVPLEEMTRHPERHRSGVQAKHDPGSALGEVLREMVDRERRDLVEDLVLAGYPVETDAQARKAEMIADCLTAMTEALADGHIEGRYPDLDEVLDVLVEFFGGVAGSFRVAGSQ